MNSLPRDPHFFELIDLAKEGDEASVDELFKSYAYDFTAQGDPRDRLPTRKTETTNKSNQEK